MFRFHHREVQAPAVPICGPAEAAAEAFRCELFQGPPPPFAAPCCTPEALPPFNPGLALARMDVLKWLPPWAAFELVTQVPGWLSPMPPLPYPQPYPIQRYPGGCFPYQTYLQNVPAYAARYPASPYYPPSPETDSYGYGNPPIQRRSQPNDLYGYFFPPARTQVNPPMAPQLHLQEAYNSQPAIIDRTQRRIPGGDLPRPIDQTPDSNINSTDVAGLKAAIARAQAGGKPLSILHYGDSHVAAGIEQRALKDLFQQDHIPVTYTTKAKVGKTAAYPLGHTQEWLDQPIAQSNPDLVLVSFGSNESAGAVDPNKYKNEYKQLISEIHKRAPGATIILVGPPDGDSIIGANKGRTLPNLDKIIALQKAVAAEQGLDYFDSRTAMGGPGSIENWSKQGLVSSDMLHFNAKGYKKLGGMIFDHINQSMQTDRTSTSA